jgi:hypothetical protein
MLSSSSATDSNIVLVYKFITKIYSLFIFLYYMLIYIVPNTNFYSTLFGIIMTENMHSLINNVE